LTGLEISIHNLYEDQRHEEKIKQEDEMRFRNYTVLMILTVFVLLIADCWEEKTGWRGTVSQEDGITIISNPKEPMYAGEVLTLEKDLTIGGSDQDTEKVFNQLLSLDVDDRGNIFILSNREAGVFVYDNQGNFLIKFGNRGQGPGEFQSPVSISVQANKIMIADQARKISFFDRQGNFLNSFSTTQYSLLMASLDSKGNIYGLEAGMVGDDPAVKLLKFDQEMNFIGEFAAYLIPADKGLDPFMPFPLFQIGLDDMVVFSRPEDYSLEYYDADGRLFCQVKKAYRPVRISHEDKDKMKEKLYRQAEFEFEYHPGFGTFIVDDQGWLFVQTFDRSPEGNYIYDVFDAEGRFITRIPIKGQPLVGANERLYCREEDEDGFDLVVRYLLK